MWSTALIREASLSASEEPHVVRYTNINLVDNVNQELETIGLIYRTSF